MILTDHNLKLKTVKESMIHNLLHCFNLLLLSLQMNLITLYFFQAKVLEELYY